MMKNTMLESSCFPNQLIAAFYTFKILQVLPSFPLSETYIHFNLGNNPIALLGSSLQ